MVEYSDSRAQFFQFDSLEPPEPYAGWLKSGNIKYSVLIFLNIFFIRQRIIRNAENAQ